MTIDSASSWEERHPWWRGRRGVLWVVVLFGIGFMILWTGAHEISDLRTDRYPLYFDWETRIPFQHWALWIYLPHDAIIILVAIFFRSWREATPMYGTLLLQTAIAVPFFLLIPIQPGYDNEMATGVWGTYGFELIGIKNISQWNHMPSLHVSFVFLMAVVLGERFGAIGWWIAIPWAILVSITTMLVHEHHLICVVAGFILFLATAWSILPWLKSRCGLRADGRDPGLGMEYL